MFFFDFQYLIFMAPFLLLSLVASMMTRSAFKKYSRQRVASGLTGAQAAARMLHNASIDDVEIVRVAGRLSDHYNPVTKKLALSEPVYDQSSVAAVGVACHEAGHAIQHATAYKPLWLRSALVPTVGIGTNLGYITMAIGAFLTGGEGSLGHYMVLFGAALFSMVLLFQVVTLPVEFDASARAKKLAFQQGMVLDAERAGMSRVLNAAALTYVAAAVSTLMTIIFFLLRAGILGGSRD